MNPTNSLRSPARLSKTRQNTQRPQNMHLPGLPRFHPANYSSLDTSGASVLHAEADKLLAQYSPRQQYRQFSESQRHLYLYAYDFGRHGPLPLTEMPIGKLRSRPTSPRLNPLGSPGPVTPFDLEEQDNYMSVRSTSHKSLNDLAKIGHEEDDDVGPPAMDSLLALSGPPSKPGAPSRV